MFYFLYNKNSICKKFSGGASLLSLQPSIAHSVRILRDLEKQGINLVDLDLEKLLEESDEDFVTVLGTYHAQLDVKMRMQEKYDRMIKEKFKYVNFKIFLSLLKQSFKILLN